MEEVKNTIEKVADTTATVLICGESGTGKEVVARMIYAQSGRFDKPFVKVNCAAIPHELLESELFGYEPGAFTGANPAKAGQVRPGELRDSVSGRSERDASRAAGQVAARSSGRRVLPSRRQARPLRRRARAGRHQQATGTCGPGGELSAKISSIA
jgi:hypothetical protein